MANYNTSTLITTNLDEIYGLICIGTDNTGKVITPESLVNSPSLTGVPLAPTAAIDTNTTQIATTAFVSTAIENVKTIYESVLNADTVALAKGTPVRIVGSTGNEARVVAADASSSFPAQLVLNEDLVVGASGLAVAVGFINNVSVPDASIYSPGDEVWLAAGGGWTTTRPTGSASLQKLGIIVKVNVGGNTVSGILTIANVEDLPNLASGNIWLGDGFGVPQESQLLLGTIGDVDTTSTPPTDKQVLQYQSGTGLWTPVDGIINSSATAVAYADGGTSTIDADNGSNAFFSLTANGTSTTLAVSNVPTTGTRYGLELHLTWTSGAITFPASWSKGEDLPSEIGNYVITAVTIDGGTSFKVTVLPEYNVEILLNITTTASPQTFTLPMTSSGLYIATIDWGDGSKSEITSYNDPDLTHSYASAGSYTIFLRGVIGGIYFFNGTGDKLLVNSVDYKNATRIDYAFFDCSNLQSFTGQTSGINNFSGAWYNCSSLTSFPLIDTSSGIYFSWAWVGCTSLTSFPLINTSSGTLFNTAWAYCSSLTSFPLIDTSSGTSFDSAWAYCTSLTSFPASFFDSWTGTPVNNCFNNTWLNCTRLTSQSVENILTSIDTSGQSPPASGVNIRVDYNGTGLTAATTTAITNLKGKGWTVTINGVLQ